ncbi:MAG: cobalamin-binding protein [Deltaproteobacteria bacterium]|nr:cobalamin-binding protein [Deltaproteobacteria bacterium]
MRKSTLLVGLIALFLIHGALAALVLLARQTPESRARVDQGRQVLPARPPQRLVSLAPSITEILYFLEQGDKVVGVTAFCNYPSEVKNKPRIGTYWDFNLEAILALKPDLALGMAHQGEGQGAYEILKEWGVPLYLAKADTLAELFHQVQEIARLTGSEETAHRKLPGLEDRVRRIENGVHGLPKPKVFLQIDQEPLITVGRLSIHNDLIERAGGENIAGHIDQRYPVYSLEEVLRARPEVILFTGMVGEKVLPLRLKFWRPWSMLPAVENKRLSWVDPDLIDRPGPRLVDGLEFLARFFHPGVIRN